MATALQRGMGPRATRWQARALWLGLMALPAQGTAQEERVPPRPTAEVLAERVAPSVFRLGVFHAGEQVGNGTGFVVDASGVLVTNHHVVEDVRGELWAVSAKGDRFRVMGLLADDPGHDLALLRVTGQGFVALPLADGASVQVGQDVVVVGSTRGLDQSLGVGVVSALRPDGFPADMVEQRKREGRPPPLGPILQHTATSGPGASGSPVLNALGQVVGVHHSGFTDGTLKFAAHVDALKALLARTDLQAPPTPLKADTSRNLLVSLGFFAVVALVWAVVTRSPRSRSRAN